MGSDDKKIINILYKVRGHISLEFPGYKNTLCRNALSISSQKLLSTSFQAIIAIRSERN